MNWFRRSVFSPAVFAFSNGYTHDQVRVMAKTLRDFYEQDSARSPFSLLRAFPKADRSGFLNDFERACVVDLKIASRMDWLLNHRIGGDFFSQFEWGGRRAESPFSVQSHDGKSSQFLNDAFYPYMRIRYGQDSSWYLNKDGRIVYEDSAAGQIKLLREVDNTGATGYKSFDVLREQSPRRAFMRSATVFLPLQKPNRLGAEFLQSEYKTASFLLDWNMTGDVKEQLADSSNFTVRPAIVPRDRLEELFSARRDEGASLKHFFRVEQSLLPESLRSEVSGERAAILGVQEQLVDVYRADAGFYYGNGCTHFVPKGMHYIIGGQRLVTIERHDRLLVDEPFDPHDLNQHDGLQHCMVEL
ncbi:MAG: hypothetical protein ACRBCT_05315 [Alphaproteobacteria bacterium]